MDAVLNQHPASRWLSYLFLLMIGLAFLQPDPLRVNQTLLIMVFVSGWLLWRIPELRAELKQLSGLLLFIVFFASSTVWSGLDSDAQWRIVRKSLNSFLFLIVAYISLRAICCDPQRRQRVSQGLSMLVILGSGAALWLYFSQGHYPARMRGFAALLDTPIQAPSILIVISALAWLLADRQKLAVRLSYLALLAALGFTLATSSRGALITWLVLAAFMACHQLQRRQLIRLAMAGILLSVAGAVAIALAMDDPLNHLAHTHLRFGDRFYRLEIWGAVLQHSNDYWLFGHGAGTRFSDTAAGAKAIASTGLPHIRHPHSLLFSTLFMTGLAGCLLLASVAIDYLRRLLHSQPAGLRTPLLILPLLAALLTATDYAYVVDGTLELKFIFWLPLAAAIALALPVTQSARQTQSAEVAA